MKQLTELKFEELSLEQKLGLATISFTWAIDSFPANNVYLEELIRKRALGGIWVASREGQNDEFLKHLKELADYPLLVFTDAEAGLGDYTVGRHNAIGITDNEELAYTFGKVTAAQAAARGYNVVCNPVLDLTFKGSLCGSTSRSYGSDKYRVAELAAAEAQGMHDGGCLTIGKHFPGRGAPRTNATKKIVLLDFTTNSNPFDTDNNVYPIFIMNTELYNIKNHILFFLTK